MDAALEASTMRKVYIRLLPFAMLSYILAYIDRINVSFAALTMRGDLHMSAGDFGFAVGTFYWAYFLFEVPSNVIMEKVGARLWIARIMITWGLFAGATAFVTSATSFGVVRFLLGMAEAGFFPGLVLYFTYWFPARHHARIVSSFLVGLPIAVAFGAPISTGLMGLDGLFGLRSWLTMIPYICGGISLVVWGRISDRMNERRWNLLIACILSTGGLVMAGLTMGTWWSMVGMSLAAMGFYGSKGPFFAMPPMFLSGTALAAGFAWINSIGNLGGFFGPWWVGVMKDLTGSYAGGLYGLALLSLVSAVGCAPFLPIPHLITPPPRRPALPPPR